jgi:hypothetical protein
MYPEKTTAKAEGGKGSPRQKTADMLRSRLLPFNYSSHQFRPALSRVLQSFRIPSEPKIDLRQAPKQSFHVPKKGLVDGFPG